MSLPLVEELPPTIETVDPYSFPGDKGLMHSQRPLFGEAAAGVIPLGYENYHAGLIATAISLGELSVGDRLPSESELAEDLGIAVATVRKSLAELRDDGLVETLRGRSGGTFVVQVPFPSDEQVRQYLAGITLVNLRDFGDERTTISRGLVNFACQRIQQGSISSLYAAADRFLQAEDPSSRARDYSRFHTEIALAAQSPRLLQHQMRLLSEISSLLWSQGGAGMLPEDVERDHEELIQALERRDPDAAKQTIQRHVQDGVYRLIDVKITQQNRPDTD